MLKSGFVSCLPCLDYVSLLPADRAMTFMTSISANSSMHAVSMPVKKGKEAHSVLLRSCFHR